MGVYQAGTPIEISDTFTVDGVETDPTVVTYTILDPSGATTVYVNGDPQVSNPSVGNFVLSLDPPLLPGEYFYDVDATGAVVASRAASFSVLPNVATGAAVDWATFGPCTPWTDSQDVWDCCGQPMTTIGEGSMATECPVDMSQFAFEASQVLYELSGRRFSGHCSRIVRPCQTACGCGWQVLSRGHLVNWQGDSWCDETPCGCRPLSKVKLAGYPVREITEVLIDGVAVDPSTYRLDRRRYLVRVRDPADPDTVLRWPSCQSLDLADDKEGTFSVAYAFGQDPPLIGVSAAAQLGCELYKQCADQTCALPKGTTRVTRQGVTIEKPAFAAWAFSDGGWKTGLTLVDAFLNAYNSAALKRRPIFWAPSSTHRYAPSVGS